ncbi:hypothetical protein SAMN05216420_102337 [Nitrosospira sp. Nl5]|uniref:hypothetical protein n=1 Tax=Nitrosospira sp. Nl5 TaxID=200120 RepID=UPI000888B79A|nr:hypothetical protein [Nitrosospira sp. Nl5]SCY11301.1 hypothetical protein SAMN05216420_102337 [Nitrosospira sp. Nl5]
MKKILEVTEVELAVLESFPPQLRIDASGTVPTGGWSNPRLVPYIYIQPPPDGIFDFDFVADPPEGIATQVISPIDAIYVWKDFPEKFRGVRIHASQNAKTALLEAGEPEPELPDRQPNRFTLSGCDDSTHIVFFPQVFMPLGASETPPDSQLEYDGAEGHLVFRGNDISQEQSILGLIVSVILQPNADAGGLDFALILPPVNLGDEAQQEFETIGVKIRSRGRVVDPAGAELTYEVLKLKGVAEDIPIL